MRRIVCFAHSRIDAANCNFDRRCFSNVLAPGRRNMQDVRRDAGTHSSQAHGGEQHSDSSPTAGGPPLDGTPLEAPPDATPPKDAVADAENVDEREVRQRKLAESAITGDGGDAGALFLEHDGPLRGYIYCQLQLRLRNDVEDVLQRAYMTAWRLIQSDFEWRGINQFEGWLIRIASREVSRHVRHERAEKRDHRRTVGNPSVGSDPDSPRVLDQIAAPAAPAPLESRSEESELLRRARSKLSDRDREILRLAIDEELSLQEVAEQLGITYDAAKMAASRARKRLIIECKKLRSANDFSGRS